MSVAKQITEYLKGANEELRKVVWPTRQETLNSTAVVVGVCVAVGAFFWVLDLLFNFVIAKLIK